MHRLEDLKHVAEEHGYTLLAVLFESDRHVLLGARWAGDEEILVVKATAREEERPQILNEHRTNVFLAPRIPENAPFAVLPSRIVYADGGAVAFLARNELRGTWLAAKKGGHALNEEALTEDVREAVFRFLLFLHRIPEGDVPDHFRERARKEFGPAQTVERQRDYLAEPLATGLVTPAEASILLSMVRDAPDLRRFVHHDVQYSNMAVTTDGTLAIIDAEFARWGMKWYDVAYRYLQSAVLYGDTETAVRDLAYDARRFAEEEPGENLREEIFRPLAFRISANLMLAARDRSQARRARLVLERVLARRFDALLTPIVF